MKSDTVPELVTYTIRTKKLKGNSAPELLGFWKALNVSFPYNIYLTLSFSIVEVSTAFDPSYTKFELLSIQSGEISIHVEEENK